MITLGDAILSPWFVGPLAGLTMLVVAVHLSVTERAPHPPSRKRIRLANGWVMLTAIPLLAAGFAFIDPQRDPRGFVLVWLAATGLLGLCVCLALADMANNVRLARRSRRTITTERVALAMELARARLGIDGPEPDRGAHD